MSREYVFKVYTKNHTTITLYLHQSILGLMENSQDNNFFFNTANRIQYRFPWMVFAIKMVLSLLC